MSYKRYPYTTWRERLEYRWQAFARVTVCRALGHPWERKMSGRVCRRCRVFESR